MEQIMKAIGAVLRTPFALFAYVFLAGWCVINSLLRFLQAIAWVLLWVPLSFIGTAMGGTKNGKSASERYKEECARNVRDWKYALREPSTSFPGIARWWATGSSKRPLPARS